MDEVRKVIALAVEARVLGVWGMHSADEDGVRHCVTHIPTGRRVGAWVHSAAERVFLALAERLPRFGEDGTFGGYLPGVNMQTMMDVRDGAVRGLEAKR